MKEQKIRLIQSKELNWDKFRSGSEKHQNLLYRAGCFVYGHAAWVWNKKLDHLNENELNIIMKYIK